MASTSGLASGPGLRRARRGPGGLADQAAVSVPDLPSIEAVVRAWKWPGWMCRMRRRRRRWRPAVPARLASAADAKLDDHRCAKVDKESSRAW